MIDLWVCFIFPARSWLYIKLGKEVVWIQGLLGIQIHLAMDLLLLCLHPKYLILLS
jgi:hypothetical protein